MSLEAADFFSRLPVHIRLAKCAPQVLVLRSLAPLLRHGIRCTIPLCRVSRTTRSLRAMGGSPANLAWGALASAQVAQVHTIYAPRQPRLAVCAGVGTCDIPCGCALLHVSAGRRRRRSSRILLAAVGSARTEDGPADALASSVGCLKACLAAWLSSTCRRRRRHCRATPPSLRAQPRAGPAMSRLYRLMGVDSPFDPTHRFETSWLLPPWALFGVRALIVSRPARCHPPVLTACSPSTPLSSSSSSSPGTARTTTRSTCATVSATSPS